MYTFALCNFEKRKEEKGRKEGITVHLFVIICNTAAGLYLFRNKQTYGNPFLPSFLLLPFFKITQRKCIHFIFNCKFYW